MGRWTDGVGLGLRWGMPFVISTGLSGMVFGWLSAQKGISLTLASLMSAIAFSGTAQLTTIQFWGDALPLAAILLAAASVNARYLAMGAVLRPLLAPGGGHRPGPRHYGLMALLTDPGWVLALKASQTGRDTWGVLLGSSLGMYVAWIAGTTIGHVLPKPPEGYLATAAGFLTLTMFAVMLPDLWKGRRDLPGWVVAVLVAALALPWIGTSWAVLAGGFTGALVRMAGDER
ncbi:AzlC family ABC transporter permease [Arenibaculum pallidiluteum]|uniref:AzlC family ABC transporter permease n=1 Tax=Arenibaculum pallidiluteum TaxID=2812559 RepID=UPI001A97AF99|nr:AzlC family ABC transporter permease [Arenibaculum pallidiluteum]